MTYLETELPNNSLIARFGICRYDNPFQAQDIAAFNAALDPLFMARESERRAYVHANELYERGILDRVLSQPMRAILFSIMPDPVLYHCHVSEIAANDTRPHIFSETLSGWHRDLDSELVRGAVTHVTVFVYLTDVGEQDGAFEFAPKDPAGWLHRGTPRLKVTGERGFTFAWQRSFYHRASPNCGTVRRRVLKLSVQRNRFVSAHLKNPHFQALLRAVPAGDTPLDILLGRYQGRKAPDVSGFSTPVAYKIEPAGRLDLPNIGLAKDQLRQRARQLKALIRRRASADENAAYD